MTDLIKRGINMVRLEILGTNFTKVISGDCVYFFSYETCIAFAINGELVISKNIWSNTTSKHLNLIDTDKTIRIDYLDFKEELSKI